MLRKTPTGTWLPAWVPESTFTLSFLLIICSIVQSSTGGYDGSMLNGLNILPSYTDYFNLTPATTGLNTASVFIGGFFGPIFSGVMADRLGRRPAILWGSLITLIGVILQTAAQDVAIVGALLAAGITLGTGQWQSTWAWRAPSLFQGIFSLLCIIVLPFIPESPRWLVHQGHHETARLVVAQTNANGDQHDPVVVAVYKEIVDTLKWEKEEGRSMTVMQVIKNPIARKRLLIGMSPGYENPFGFCYATQLQHYPRGETPHNNIQEREVHYTMDDMLAMVPSGSVPDGTLSMLEPTGTGAQMQVLTGKSNFSRWKTDFITVADAKGLSSIIHGEEVAIPYPDKDDYFAELAEGTEDAVEPKVEFRMTVEEDVPDDHRGDADGASGSKTKKVKKTVTINKKVSDLNEAEKAAYREFRRNSRDTLGPDQVQALIEKGSKDASKTTLDFNSRLNLYKFNLDQYEKFRTREKLARALLMYWVQPTIRASIRCFTSPSDIWTYLHQQYRLSPARAFEIANAHFEQLHLTNFSNVQDFINELFSAQQDILDADGSCSDALLVSKMMRSLTPPFKQFVAQYHYTLDMFDDSPSLAQMTARLLTYESDCVTYRSPRPILQTRQPFRANQYPREQRGPRDQCTGCGKWGHKEPDCRTTHPELRPQSSGFQSNRNQGYGNAGSGRNNESYPQRPYSNNTGYNGGQRPYNNNANAGYNGGQRPYSNNANTGTNGAQRSNNGSNNANRNNATSRFRNFRDARLNGMSAAAFFDESYDMHADNESLTKPTDMAATACVDTNSFDKALAHARTSSSKNKLTKGH
ncbi:hypothetical protein LTR85_001892 [Meristemomyces frigidus]|nr:hypothetical protein LTR85_001892 [Meristemomyces frigidus]